MNVVRSLAALAVMIAAVANARADTHRLYDGVTAFIPNPDGKDFKLTVAVRDINIFENGPREVLFKVYDPDGVAVIREVIPDDGVTTPAYQQPAGAWDHEGWYYAFCSMQGAAPMLRWSAFSAPDRLATIPKRPFTRQIQGGKKGVWRVVIVGAIDHYVTLSNEPELPYGVAGNTEFLHGSGAMFRRGSIYVPKGTRGLHIALIEYDQPRTRRVTIKAADGKALFDDAAPDGFRRTRVLFDKLGQYDDQLLSVEVPEGKGDFLLGVVLLRDEAEGKTFRGDPAVAAVIAPDDATAKAIRNGAIEHDGQVFWQPFQVRLHDWLKKLKPEEFIVTDGTGQAIDAAKLPEQPGFMPLNGPHWRPPLSDTIMHHWAAHRNRNALHLALRDLSVGLRHLGPGDHIANGPFRNMGYEFSTYSFHYYRPAWRILQQSDAPAEVKAIVREAFLVCGDRLAFCRGWARVNGNAFAHVPMALRYCHEATGDELQKQLFDTYFSRFLSGGWGERVGVGPSGPVQEGFAYDYHYTSYVLASYKSVTADLKDERFQKVHDRLRTWFSYTLADENVPAGPWASRTLYYPQWTIEKDGPFAWKGLPGPDFTVNVNDGNEWFAARRKHYYALTYHGRLSPRWNSNAHAGQAGYGGGTICQLHVPGKGPVLAGTLNGNYGENMHPSQWRSFHIHSVVGQTADTKPLVAADSEHLDARLNGTTVTSSGEVRDSSVYVTRSFTFGAEDITCEVRLRETGHNDLLSLWVKNPMRGQLTEAYEMIPFVGTKPGKAASKLPEDQTTVTVTAPDGKTAPLTRELAQAKSLVIDRGGFGVRIELDQACKVRLGERDTILIQLIDAATPASKVSLRYRLAPFGAP